MIVMMMASTPSLNASNRLVRMAPFLVGERRDRAVPPPADQESKGLTIAGTTSAGWDAPATSRGNRDAALRICSCIWSPCQTHSPTAGRPGPDLPQTTRGRPVLVQDPPESTLTGSTKVGCILMPLSRRPDPWLRVTVCADGPHCPARGHGSRVCQTNGVTLLVENYLRPADRRPSKVISKALRAGFQRIVQRRRPCPVGSRLITAR